MDNNIFELIDNNEMKEKKANPNEKPCQLVAFANSLEDDERKAYYALRSRKATETRKSNIKYNSSIQKSVQALANGTFSVFDDGTELTGADILALGAFERARYSDKAFANFVKLTGDLVEAKEEEKKPYEEFLRNVKVKF